MGLQQKKESKHKDAYKIDNVLFMFTIVILFITVGCSPKALDNEITQVSSTPEDVVKMYFESWDKKSFDAMYAVISDGFKKIDENAKNLESFKDYASKQGISGVNILSIKKQSENGETATVDYSIEFVLANDKTKKFDGTFTLKYRKNDIVHGWKLIHPYGKNIDTS